MAGIARHPGAGSARLIKALALTAVVLAFGVVVLGAYVRLTAAGLGCPDWPGCYGHLTPRGAERALAAGAALPGSPLDVAKAWREMIHRYAASSLGLVIVVIAALALTARRERVVSVAYALALVGLVALQGALGMLTVTLQLTPLIVTLHLLFGLTTMSLLWWLWLSLRAHSGWGTAHAPLILAYPVERRAVRIVAIALAAVALQIALGGWTSSNYAAIACPDLPKCQGAWWPPTTDFHDAFVLWHAPGVNYEGGVLAGPARVAIHLTHRLGAIVASTAVLVAVLTVWRARPLAFARRAALAVLAALLLQLAIGMTMVHYAFPLALATAHNAGAALTLLALTALLHRLRGHLPHRS